MNVRVKEAAARLGLSKSTLDKLRCFGGGPAYFKLGRAVVYSTAELDHWLETRRRSSTWASADNDNAAARGGRAA
jgi:excisionase family DNA binding protein